MNIPAGWKLVPVEPTEEMLAALGTERLPFSTKRNDEPWHKMLAAAPTPPALQLETQISDKDVKTLLDYMARMECPPARD